MLPDLLPRARRVLPVSASLAERLGAVDPGAARGTAALLALVPAPCSCSARSRCRGCAGTTTSRRCRSSTPPCRPRTSACAQRVSDFDGGRFVIALGADAESAAARNEDVHRRLAALVTRRQARRTALAARPVLPARAAGAEPRRAARRPRPAGAPRRGLRERGLPARHDRAVRAPRSPRRRRRSGSRSCARRRSASSRARSCSSSASAPR